MADDTTNMQQPQTDANQLASSADLFPPFKDPFKGKEIINSALALENSLTAILNAEAIKIGRLATNPISPAAAPIDLQNANASVANIISKMCCVETAAVDKIKTGIEIVKDNRRNPELGTATIVSGINFENALANVLSNEALKIASLTASLPKNANVAPATLIAANNEVANTIDGMCCLEQQLNEKIEAALPYI